MVKTYSYNAENKETGEASEYEYNALGYRTALTQKKKNPSASFVNNLNSFGNNYSEFVQEIAKKDSDIEQKTFDDVLGLTRQLLLPTVKTEFVADYTSYAKVDLVAYENGSYTTTYTYGENDEKVSQSVSHHVGLTDVLEGKNPLTQIATTNIKKAYYHKTRQGSTAYVTDKDGQVLAFTEYDAWGKMETQKPSTMNFAGLDDITDYTGHTYDEVLEKYFAQARFYDAVNRRFVTGDPVKDGLNWYIYVGNNPVNLEDLLGLAASNTKGTSSALSQLLTTNVSVRETHKKYGHTVDFNKGASKGNSTIEIGFSVTGDLSATINLSAKPVVITPNTTTLYEGTDYYIGSDGIAYYYAESSDYFDFIVYRYENLPSYGDSSEEEWEDYIRSYKNHLAQLHPKDYTDYQRFYFKYGGAVESGLDVYTMYTYSKMYYESPTFTAVEECPNKPVSSTGKTGIGRKPGGTVKGAVSNDLGVVQSRINGFFAILCGIIKCSMI